MSDREKLIVVVVVALFAMLAFSSANQPRQVVPTQLDPLPDSMRPQPVDMAAPRDDPPADPGCVGPSCPQPSRPWRPFR